MLQKYEIFLNYQLSIINYQLFVLSLQRINTLLL